MIQNKMKALKNSTEKIYILVNFSFPYERLRIITKDCHQSKKTFYHSIMVKLQWHRTSAWENIVIDNTSGAFIVNKKLKIMFLPMNWQPLLLMLRSKCTMNLSLLGISIEFTRKKKRRKWTEKDSQKSLIGQEIDSLKLLIAGNVRTADLLETD